jgi:dipeptide/tripeptide permease
MGKHIYSCSHSAVTNKALRAPYSSGAPPRNTQQNAGALGKGSVVASAVLSSFAFLGYGLPLFTGWAADAKLGRFQTICIGVAIMLIAHVVMIIAAIPSILKGGHAEGPFYLSVYLVAIGSGMLFS